MSVFTESPAICDAVSPPICVDVKDWICVVERRLRPAADRAAISPGVNALIWPALRLAAAVVRPPSCAVVRFARLSGLKFVALSPLSCAVVSA